MVLEAEDFTLEISYNEKADQLKLNSNRELKNSDVLLILIHIMSLVDESTRQDIVDLSLATLQERAREQAVSAN